MLCRYLQLLHKGPATHRLVGCLQDRKVGFSDSGRLQVDVKLASFATRIRGRVQQVSGMQWSYKQHNTHAVICLAAAASIPS